MSLDELVEISRFYGTNPDYVVAGGGNTSFKDTDFLYVKASGTKLAAATAPDFVKMSRAALARVWQKSYPMDSTRREAAVLADMMAARAPGEEKKRPSVECLLHDILPFAYIVHTHPSLVNGLTCSQNGEAVSKELFPGSIWIPSVNPGYILSKTVKDAMDTYRAEKGKPPELIFLQNHGVFVGADTTDKIKALYQVIDGRIAAKIKRQPDLGGKQSVYGNSDEVGRELQALAGKAGGFKPEWFFSFERNNESAKYIEGAAAFKCVSSAFTPDHIVYSGSDPLFIESLPALEETFKAHVKRTGRIPKIAAVQGLGVFGLGNSKKTAETALELFDNTIKVSVYTESFGGPLFMSKEQIDFINNWEVESYRAKVSS
ncbi:MAG: class II aldolase/adducin family protein [Treponema sp.]|jgi:rhamnose utilization protein RhaD (predicted bifunctional aldolase and dehydrogenase)|nr:class II aldolase/adducin family protein [Treponema sp.]